MTVQTSKLEQFDKQIGIGVGGKPWLCAMLLWNMGATIELRRNPVAKGRPMPYIFADAAGLAGKPQVGDAECVALIKTKVPGLIGIATVHWKEGASVKSLPYLLRGTAIATFVNGRYPQHGINGKHACLFLSHSGAGIWVIDQYRNSGTIIKRHIGIPREHLRRADGTWPDASNNALAFSVIER